MRFSCLPATYGVRFTIDYYYLALLSSFIIHHLVTFHSFICIHSYQNSKYYHVVAAPVPLHDATSQTHSRLQLSRVRIASCQSRLSATSDRNRVRLFARGCFHLRLFVCVTRVWLFLFNDTLFAIRSIKSNLYFVLCIRSIPLRCCCYCTDRNCKPLFNLVKNNYKCCNGLHKCRNRILVHDRSWNRHLWAENRTFVAVKEWEMIHSMETIQ